MRPAFGKILKDWITGCDYFGWGDIDVIYGNMMKFLTSDVLNHQVIAFNDLHLSGSLTLLHSEEATDNLFPHLIGENWQKTLVSELLNNPGGGGVDEPHPDRLRRSLRVYARESYSTPLSPLIKWRDGSLKSPTEWYWRNGRLTNDLDGEDLEGFYLHFLHWKGGPWPRQCGNAQWESRSKIVHVEPGREESGFKVNKRGFFPLKSLE